MALLGRCLWGGTDGCLWSGCSHQLPWARPALQQLFFCGLVPSKAFCLLSRRKGEHPRCCRVGAPSASGTAALGGVAYRGGLPQLAGVFPRHPAPPPAEGARLPRGVSLSSHGPQLSWNATLAWPCALALPLPACQRPRTIRFLSCSLLQFLRASLETIGDDAWIKRLSCALSQRLDSSPSSSGEKVGSPPGSPLAAQPRGAHVRGWGWGCRRCSAHEGCLRCFPGPCRPRPFPPC